MWNRFLGAAALSYVLYEKRKALWGNIAGYIGPRPQALNMTFDGIQKLSTYGYDSWGIGTILENGEIRIVKSVNDPITGHDSITDVKEQITTEEFSDCQLAIAHLRWATTGAKIQINAHPFTDHKDRIALVHCGHIHNKEILSSKLNKAGIKIVGSTDSEIIAKLIGLYMDRGLPIMEAVQKALSKLDGTWAISMINRLEPNSIILARKGSPLMIGLGKSSREYFIGSSTDSFDAYCSEYVSLQDDEIVKLDKNSVFPSERLEKITGQTGKEESNIMLEEILQQPDAVLRALNYGARIYKDNIKLKGLDENESSLIPCRNVQFAAMGSSQTAALFGEYLFKILHLFNSVQHYDPTEYKKTNRIAPNSLLLAISQSGETEEVLRVFRDYKEKGIKTISVTNSVGSTLASLDHWGVYCNTGREFAESSTKSFLNTIVVLAEIALWFSYRLHNEEQRQIRTEMNEELSKFPFLIGSILKECETQVPPIAEAIKNQNNMFVLGRGITYAAASEGALKFKEVTQIHAEWYPVSSLKHGPYAVIEDDYPVIVPIFNDEHKDAMTASLEQLHGRGVQTIAITNDRTCFDNSKAKHIIEINTGNGRLGAVLMIVAIQMLAYYTAKARGLDPNRLKSNQYN